MPDATQAVTGALRDCARIELPTHLVDGAGVVDQVNLRQRTAVQDLLHQASDENARGWILAAGAAGVTGPALTRFAQHLATMSQDKRAALDPTTASGIFTQPDGTTCGFSSLVMAKMINDPTYVMYVVTGYDPRTGQQEGRLAPVPHGAHQLPETTDSQTQAMHDRFQREAFEMHHQTSSLTAHDGAFNGWWPEAAGTSPGAAARQMSGGAGLSGVPGTTYDTSYVDPTNRARSHDDIIHAVDGGHAVPVYTYDVQNSTGASGAHVVLVAETEGDNLRVYEPGEEVTKTVTRQEFVTASLASTPGTTAPLLGWDKPLVAVAPQ